MPSNRRSSLVGLLAALVLLASACGGQEGNTPTTVVATPTMPAVTPTAPSGAMTPASSSTRAPERTVVATATPRVGTTQVAAATPTAFERRAIELINERRAENGLAPLEMDESLNRAADRYAETMARTDTMSHTGPAGSTPEMRVEEAGYTDWRFIAENVAAGQPTPEEVVTGWMDSEHHRENILAEQATEIGVGYSENPDSQLRHFWVMNVGAPQQ